MLVLGLQGLQGLWSHSQLHGWASELRVRAVAPAWQGTRFLPASWPGPGRHAHLLAQQEEGTRGHLPELQGRGEGLLPAASRLAPRASQRDGDAETEGSRERGQGCAA